MNQQDPPKGQPPPGVESPATADSMPPAPESLNLAASEPQLSRFSARPGLPVLPPKTALIELLVFFLAVIALEWGLNSLPDLNELEPHPFWLPVLLLSLQYGTVSGLLAAGISILFTAAMGWPEQDIGENHFNYLIRIWAEPVLWIAAAMVLGQFRMRQIAEQRELHRLAEDLHQQRAAISDYALHLRERCEMLARKLTGARGSTAGDLLDVFSALGGHDPDLVSACFGDCMEAAFGPGQYSLFLFQENELALVCSVGWDDDPQQQNFAADEPLVEALLASTGGLTILRSEDETVLANKGLAAVAVVSPSGERVLGMLKVELLPPENFDHSILRRLDIIAAQLAPLLELQSVGGAAVEQNVGRKVAPRKTAWRQQRWKSSGRQNKNATPETGPLKKPKIVR